MGRKKLAGKILDAAHRFDIPIVAESELSERLFYLETGDVVPEELYEPIAAVFAFILQIDKNMGE